MRHPLPRRAAPALAALLLLNLAACNVQGQNVGADDTDDQKAAIAKAPPVELPPSIQASKSYRCKDNSVVYVDWFSGDKQAALKDKKGGTATMLRSDTPGTDKKADGGYVLSGSASAPTIDVTMPGKDKQSCKG